MADSTYVAAIRGYITDVAELWFKRCDGRIFHFDELTDSSVSPDVQFNEVNAGWSPYPVAYLPGSGTMEMQFTSGQFDGELFAMANARKFAADADFLAPVTEHLTVVKGTGSDTSLQVTLANTPAANTAVMIGDLSSDTAAGASSHLDVEGKVVKIGNTAGISEGDHVDVSYFVSTTGASSISVNNQDAAIGEAICCWPVYNSGDDCTESSIKGHLYMDVYRCRVTAMPGFDTSYKSAATNQITLSTMDSKRTDGAAYKLVFVPLAAAGN